MNKSIRLLAIAIVAMSVLLSGCSMANPLHEYLLAASQTKALPFIQESSMIRIITEDKSGAHTTSVEMELATDRVAKLSQGVFRTSNRDDLEESPMHVLGDTLYIEHIKEGLIAIPNKDSLYSSGSVQKCADDLLDFLSDGSDGLRKEVGATIDKKAGLTHISFAIPAKEAKSLSQALLLELIASDEVREQAAQKAIDALRKTSGNDSISDTDIREIVNKKAAELEAALAATFASLAFSNLIYRAVLDQNHIITHQTLIFVIEEPAQQRTISIELIHAITSYGARPALAVPLLDSKPASSYNIINDTILHGLRQ